MALYVPTVPSIEGSVEFKIAVGDMKTEPRRRLRELLRRRTAQECHCTLPLSPGL